MFLQWCISLLSIVCLICSDYERFMLCIAETFSLSNEYLDAQLLMFVVASFVIACYLFYYSGFMLKTCSAVMIASNSILFIDAT